MPVFTEYHFRYFETDAKPIMISYSWSASRDRVKMLHKKLEDEGYSVWIDYEQMGKYL